MNDPDHGTASTSASPGDTSREREGLTLLGPDLFDRDAEGKPLSPIACVFPRHQAMVTGRGIHAGQTLRLLEHLRGLAPGGDGDDLEASVYEDAVALVVREPYVLIRLDPGAMDRCFEADEILHRLLPKDRIRFIGVQIPEVRDRVRRRGESWRIAPPPRSVEEIVGEIRQSRVQVGTGAVYYQNAPSGGRFLTYQEFLRIRPLIDADPPEALRRVWEIVELTELVNRNGVHELEFFLPARKKLSPAPLRDLLGVLAGPAGAGPGRTAEPARARAMFDAFALDFRRTAGPELAVDDESCQAWRSTMFCRLFDIDESALQEYALGLSPEFRLNVRWLPGARFNGEPRFEPTVAPRTRHLIEHFLDTRPEVEAVNVGQVTSAQTKRDRSGEQREVDLVVLDDADPRPSVRVVRMIKWDVRHRMDCGASREDAVRETIEYRNYIFDRLRAIHALQIAIPSFAEIRLVEEMKDCPAAPVFFFHREYVSGTATDKFAPASYGLPGFTPRLARLLGTAAGASLVIGRASPRDGRVYFDDGDEVVQLDDDGLPGRLVIVETTGSFVDWTTPIAEKLPQCLAKVAAHLERARAAGAEPEDVLAAPASFSEALAAEIRRMQALLADPAYGLEGLFADRPVEASGIGTRWAGVLERLRRSDSGALARQALEGLPGGALTGPSVSESR